MHHPCVEIPSRQDAELALAEAAAARGRAALARQQLNGASAKARDLSDELRTVQQRAAGAWTQGQDEFVSRRRASAARCRALFALLASGEFQGFRPRPQPPPPHPPSAGLESKVLDAQNRERVVEEDKARLVASLAKAEEGVAGSEASMRLMVGWTMGFPLAGSVTCWCGSAGRGLARETAMRREAPSTAELGGTPALPSAAPTNRFRVPSNPS